MSVIVLAVVFIIIYFTSSRNINWRKRLLIQAQKASTFRELQKVLFQSPNGDPAGKLAWKKLEDLFKEKEDLPPSLNTLLNKYALEESTEDFERMMDKIP